MIEKELGKRQIYERPILEIFKSDNDLEVLDSVGVSHADWDDEPWNDNYG